MAGERSEHMVSIAARAAGRVAEQLALVNERFAPETAQAAIRELRFEDMAREFDEAGHHFDPNCTRPFCVQAKGMIQGAIQQFVQGAPNG